MREGECVSISICVMHSLFVFEMSRYQEKPCDNGVGRNAPTADIIVDGQ